MKNKLKWNDLFNYLRDKCTFRKEDGKILWNCNGELQFVKEFCEQNKVNFEIVKSVLESKGGYCDCECIFNAEARIDNEKALPPYQVIQL